MDASNNLVIFTSLRCAGLYQEASQPGNHLGGVYHPAVLNPDGSVKTNARFEASFYLNGPGRVVDGNFVDGRKDVIRLTFWNGRTSTTGKGLADIAAKNISRGREIHCHAKLRSYDSKVFYENGDPVMRKDGTGQLTTPKIGFSVEGGSLRRASESAKTIANEVAAWDGRGGFHCRPPQWNVEGTADHQAWQQIKAWRRDQQYSGGATFGYAAVAQSTGTPAINTAGVAAATGPVSLPNQVATTLAPAAGMAVYPQGTVINGVNMSGQPIGTMPNTQAAPVYAAAGTRTPF